MSADKPSLRPRELAEISALADGSLPAERRAAVQARIDASPELRALYERERRVVELLRTARDAEQAPPRLQARVRAAVADRPVRRRVVVVRYGALASATVAAIVVAVILLLPSGTPGAPSISEAAALGALPPTEPAPVPDPSNPGVQLGQSVGEVYFPNWSRMFGWRAVGQRQNRIHGRTATTVYYVWHGRQIAYTIFRLPALTIPHARRSDVGGTVLRTLAVRGRTVVTWRRNGQTCVLSGVDVSASALRALAAWQAPSERSRNAQ
jgi:anti-sigma factor RsiW